MKYIWLLIVESFMNVIVCVRSLFIDSEKVDNRVEEHLKLNGCHGNSKIRITVSPYSDVKRFVSDLADQVSGKIWVNI